MDTLIILIRPGQYGFFHEFYSPKIIVKIKDFDIKNNRSCKLPPQEFFGM
jgi:hypothetical protein